MARESGYAMLLVFLVAAILAIALYNALPRVAFEAQRAREELLIERGEEYKRAIQLFVRKVGRYPASVDELESLNETRFLRKRYLDPMTGKEKWRLIHINGGVLTDSIVQKNKVRQESQPPANTNTFIAEEQAIGTDNDASQQPVNPAMERRASDTRPVVRQETAEPPEEVQPPAANSDGVSAGGATASTAPNTQPPGGGVYTSPAFQPPASSVYAAPALGQSGGASTAVLERRVMGDFQSGSSPRQAPEDQPAVPASASANAPPSGRTLPALIPLVPAGAQIGGGIAGVASEAAGRAIKVYNERKKYNEWEFIYDQSKDRGLTGVSRNGGAPGTPAQSMGSTPAATGAQVAPPQQQPPN